MLRDSEGLLDRLRPYPGDSHNSKHTKTVLPAKPIKGNWEVLEIKTLLKKQQQIHRHVDN